MKSDKYQIFSAYINDIGDRAKNEDSVGMYEDNDKSIWIVCDGLGGHGGGDVASKFVVNSIKASIEDSNDLENSIQQAQDNLIEKQKEEKAEDSMKTTVVCLEISDDLVKYSYVGDSRIYLFEQNKLKRRSLDHSVPQMMVNSGVIKEKEIRYHEDRSRLLRVMGVLWDKPKYQTVKDIEAVKNQSFLLCTDGFWELIEEKDMIKTLKKSNTPQEWLDKMKKIVCENGKEKDMDNYSAYAIFIRE